MDVAVMGFGTVGTGVVELLEKNHKNIVEKSGAESIELKYILDIRDFPDSPYADKLIKDFNVILNDENVKIVVETMGGLKPAFDFVAACLKAGKSVVTSNKELVAVKGYELMQLACENNASFLFEASVGGGIPIIRPLGNCLAANEIEDIAGILNGTTNFILDKMIKESVSFESALKTAQELGYAEKDPAADVEGLDACRKICILAALGFGHHVYPESVSAEGITDITLRDVEYAASIDGVIKLIARAKRLENGRIAAYVSPSVVKNSMPLSKVDGVFNAICVKGNAVGETMFYGRGAGKLPTASAVVADVIDCARHIDSKKLMHWQSGEDSYVEDMAQLPVSMLIRGSCEDEAAVRQSIRELFGDVCFAQPSSAEKGSVAFVTPTLIQSRLDEDLASIAGFKIESRIRVLEF